MIELGYDAAGRPAWWVACGRIDATLRFRAPRGEALPGADPACATVKEAGSAGELVLDFRGSRAARLAPGVLERGLERFAFGQGYCGLSLPHGGRLLPVPELSGRHLLLLAEEGPEGLRLNDWPRVVRLEPQRRRASGVAPCEWRVLREDGPAGAQPPGVLRCPGAPGEDSCRLVLPATPPWGSFAGVLDPVPTVEARLLPVDLGPGGAVSHGSAACCCCACRPETRAAQDRQPLRLRRCPGRIR
ncbi:MAG: hypothetical protein RML12_04715 [Xanthomonadales bacterium]|nr:hypothetical protein [Xanthomonadales bacterium]